jgi:hypothetical protein
MSPDFMKAYVISKYEEVKNEKLVDGVPWKWILIFSIVLIFCLGIIAIEVTVFLHNQGIQ